MSVSYHRNCVAKGAPARGDDSQASKKKSKPARTEYNGMQQPVNGEIKSADQANAATHRLCVCAVNHEHAPARDKGARARKQATYEQNKDRWPPPPRTARKKSSSEVASSSGERDSPKATGRTRGRGVCSRDLRAQWCCSAWPRSNNHLFFFQVRVPHQRGARSRQTRCLGFIAVVGRRLCFAQSEREGGPPQPSGQPSTPKHASEHRMRSGYSVLEHYSLGALLHRDRARSLT